jgi:hypothetical protein
MLWFSADGALAQSEVPLWEVRGSGASSNCGVFRALEDDLTAAPARSPVDAVHKSLENARQLFMLNRLGGVIMGPGAAGAPLIFSAMAA